MYKNCVVKLLSLFLLVLSGLSYGDVDQGYEWLAGQQQADGQFSSAQGIATPQQETTESLLALLQQTAVSFDQDAALNSIIAESGDGTEALARKIIALGKTGGDPQVYIDILLTYQNNDGGFGSYIGFESSAIDTAFVLMALEQGQVSYSVLESAINYLVAKQLSDGSFSVVDIEYSSVYVTSLVSRALQIYRFNFSLAESLSLASNFLLTALNESNISALSDWEIAVSLITVRSNTSDVMKYSQAVELLESHQDIGGAWAQDSFVTALALQSLNFAVIEQPANTALSGRVIDAGSNQPLANVDIILQGVSSHTVATEVNGQFYFSGLNETTYSLSIAALGYDPRIVSISFAQGESLSLEDIALQASENVGVISGLVTDASTNAPLIGATLTFAGSVSAVVTTDDHGAFAIEGVTGEFSVSVDFNAYQSVTASGTLAQGITTHFSPSLYLIEDLVDPNITITGKVLDALTQPILGASVTDLSGTGLSSTDGQGFFELEGVSAGEVMIEISYAGLQSLQIPLLVTPGAHIDLGDIVLASASAPDFSTLQGIITDAESGDPIHGATITIEELNLNAMSDEMGAYRIENISLPSFSFSVSAIGFSTQIANVNATQHKLVIGDISIFPVVLSDIEITALMIHDDITEYHANDEIEVDVTLLNSGVGVHSVRLLIEIVNDESQVVAQFPAVVAPIGDDSVAYLDIEPGQSVETDVEWYPGTIEPGGYQIIIQAYDASNELLAERGLSVEILPTLRVGGGVSFDPPVAHLVANSPIKLQGNINNRGNLPLDSGSLTATITLKTEGFYAPSADFESKQINNTEFLSVRAVDTDAEGNMYVVDGNTLFKLSQDGMTEIIKMDLPELFVDVIADVDNSGYFFFLASSYNYYTYDPAEGVITKINTGLVRQSVFELNSNNGLVIAYDLGVVEIDEAGNVSEIIGQGLAQASAMAMASNGTLFIADEAGSAIRQYKEGTLSTFVENIPSPSALVIATNDNLYVTSFSENSLIEISQSGDTRVITDQLSGPKDLKISSNNSFVISNYNSNEIVEVQLSGELDTLIGSSLNSPNQIDKDGAGNLVVVNYDGSLFRMDDSRSVVSASRAGGFNSPADLVMFPDDVAAVLYDTGRAIARVTADGSVETLEVQGVNNASIMSMDQSGLGYLLSSTDGLVHLTVDGIASPYLPRYFSYPQIMRRDQDGKLLILTRSGSIVRFDPATKTVQWLVEDLGITVLESKSNSGMAVAEDGVIYVSDYLGKQIIRINTDGSFETEISLNFNPGPIDLGPDGSLLIAKANSKEIYQLNSEGVVLEFVVMQAGAVWLDIRYDKELSSLWVSDARQIAHVEADGTQTYIDIAGGNIFALDLETDGSVLFSQLGKLGRITLSHEIVDVVDSSSLEYKAYLGVVRSDANQIWTVDNNGRLSSFLADGNLDQRYVSIRGISDMKWGMDGNLYMLDAGSLLRVKGAHQLAEIVADVGSYKWFDVESSSTFILAARNSIARFDLVANTLSSLVSKSNITDSMTVLEGGRIVVVGNWSSRLSEYSALGILESSMVGLVKPSAIALDENDTIYVANNTVTGMLLKQSSNGKLDEFATYSQVNNLHFLENTNLSIAYGDKVIELSRDGSEKSSIGLDNAEDRLELEDGIRLLLDDHQLFSEVDSERTLLAIGVVGINDISLDAEDLIYAASAESDGIVTISSDGSSRVVATNLSNVLDISFDSESKTLSVLDANGTNITRIDHEGNRSEIDDIFVPYRANSLISSSFDTMVVGTPNNIIQLTSIDVNDEGLNVGDIVYSGEFDISGLAVDSNTLAMDLGEWQPQQSGDYLFTLKSNNPEVDGTLINTLHVGPIAESDFSVGQIEVLSGNQTIEGLLEITGADASSLTTLETDGIVLSAESGGQGRGITADTMGNIYVADISKIIKITPDGEVNDFAIGLPRLNSGLAVDSDNVVYANSTKGVLRIDQDGSYSTLVPWASGVAVSYENEIYAFDGSSLIHVNRDGSTDLVTSGLDLPQGMTFDPEGNIYILNRDLAGGSGSGKIQRVTPEGVISVYYDRAIFEYEGINVTADCSGNLLFAPFQMDVLKPEAGEEDILVQLTRDTKEERLVLEGTTFDSTLSDMDVVYYDRFSNRVLIWTDLNNGKIFSFPVICGGIDTEVHLQTRGDVELASVEPAADSVIDLGDNQFEYIWSLKDVDIDGVKLNLNWLFTDLTEGEQRPVVENAYLQFNNSFDADNPVQVPIDIPTLTVNSQMTVAPTVDPIGYGPNTDVLITIDVSNEHSAPFSGTVQLRIVDENQVEVAVLDPLIISDLSAHTSTAIQTLWNTGAIYAGDYSIEAELMDSNGVSIAEGASNLTVSSSVGSVIVESHIASDKTLYYSSDLVTLDGWLTNPSSNSVVEASRATLTVLDPQGLVIFDYVNSFGELYPLSQQNIHVSFMLNGAPVGGYQVILEIYNTLTNALISTDSYSYSVEQIGLSASGIIGLASASSTAVTRGHELSCDYLIKNIGATEYSDLALRQLLLDVDADAQLSELNFNLSLTSQSEQQIGHDINTAALSLGGYACVLQAQLDGEWQTLDGVGFLVQDDPVLLEIKGSVAVSNTEISKAQPVTCTDSVENQNDETVTLTLHRRLHNSSFVVIDETQAAITLAPGEIYTGNRAYDTASWALGTYQCSLLANIGVSEKQIDSVGFELINVAPIANAGINQTVDTDTVVALDGTASADPNGDSISFQWFLISRPDDSVSELQNAITSAPSLLIDKKGDYTVQLIVSDGEYDSTALVTIEGLNNLPIANAGADQGVLIGDTAILDGSASTDIDGDALVYQWQIVELPPESDSTLSDANEVMPTLTIDNHGQYIIHLTVNDGEADSAIDTVTLTVGNVAPTANAGADQSGFIGETVSINGAGSSDADGDTLTYQWSLAGKPNGSSATLSDPTAVISHLTLDEHGVYSIELVVSDGIESSDADTTTINTLNTKPVADSGADRAVFVGDDVELDAQASFDADGDPVVYQWSLLSKPDTSSAALNSVDQVSPQLTIDEAGVYIVQLIVNDGIENSDPDTVLLTTQNVRPVAEAGTEQLAETGETVMLDGSNSSDPDNDLISYSWSLISQPQGSNSQIMDATAVTANFNADLAGLYVAQLIVSDDEFASEPDTVVITVESSVPPVDCDEAAVYPLSLWPPNNKFNEVQIEGMGSDVSVHVSQITQDEPLGKSAPDAIVEIDIEGGSDRIYLRSEREGNLLNGRVYQIHFEAENPQAGGCTGSVTVAVPHDQNKAPVDDGQTVDSLVSD